MLEIANTDDKRQSHSLPVILQRLEGHRNIRNRGDSRGKDLISFYNTGPREIMGRGR